LFRPALPGIVYHGEACRRSYTLAHHARTVTILCSLVICSIILQRMMEDNLLPGSSCHYLDHNPASVPVQAIGIRWRSGPLLPPPRTICLPIRPRTTVQDAGSPLLRGHAAVRPWVAVAPVLSFRLAVFRFSIAKPKAFFGRYAHFGELPLYPLPDIRINIWMDRLIA